MLTLVSGSFSKSLEKAFIKRVSELKTEPLTPLLIISPSSRIMERLQIILCENSISLINVYFHTFSSLAKMLVDEGGGLKKTLLSDSFFFDSLVKLIVEEDRPFPGIPDLAVPQGFPPQIRSTLRDMMDAGIPSKGPVLLDAVKEDYLGKEVDLAWLLQLFRFYQIYSDRLESLPEIVPHSFVIKGAIQLAPESNFLKQFPETIYYGFYDLTGLQKDFFESVVKYHPSRFFFPYLAHHPSYEFARQFKEMALLPVLKEEIHLESKDNQKEENFHEFKSQAEIIQIFNVSGLRDEAWKVSSEILKLHEDKKVPFSRMAVMARNKDRLQNIWPSFLRERNIPFWTTSKESLSSSPLVDMALQFLSCTDPEQAKINSKDFLKRTDFKSDKKDSSFDVENKIPSIGPWSQMAEISQNLLQTYFYPRNTNEKNVWKWLIDGLEDLKRFDLLEPRVKREDFLETVQEKWARTEVPPESQSPQGVSLLYAEAARGLSFDVVFLVGMEERVFPRIVREDPFLRDEARFQLRRLGYKIGEKLSALEEEKLLFQLLIDSAKKVLFLSYQRSDEEGRIVGPSVFLRTFADHNGIDLEKNVESIPRPFHAKILEIPPRYLSNRDIIFRLLYSGHSSQALTFVEKVGGDGKNLQKGLTFIKNLNQFGDPGQWDGCLPPLPLKEIFPQGTLSATRLEVFGRCPFQFFGTKLLNLEPLEEEEIGVRMPPDKKGNLIHAFFEKFYMELREKKYAMNSSFPKATFETIFHNTFGGVTSQDMQVHPVLWDVYRENIRKDLVSFIVRDMHSLAEGGLEPKYFEEEISEALDPPLDGFEWYGKPDRVDVGSNKARILDYKTGWITGNPLLASLQGLKIQPALYILLVEKFLRAHDFKPASLFFVYQQLGASQAESQLSYQDWLDYKPQILETIKSQVDLMFDGRFLILPDDRYCGWCEIQTVCRKNHGPSASRAQEGAGKTLALIRSKKRKKSNLKETKGRNNDRH